MMLVLEKQAPLLYSEFKAIQTPSISTTSEITPEQIAAQLSAIINKKTLTLPDLNVSKEVMHQVLEFMYEKNFDVTSANLSEVCVLSTRFGMEKLMSKCLEVFKQTTFRPENFIEALKKATLESSPFFPMLKTLFMDQLSVIPKDKLLEYTSSMSFEEIMELVKSELTCEEILVWDIAEAWRMAHAYHPQLNELMSHVRLELLHPTVLLSKVREHPHVNPNAYNKALEIVLAHISSPNINIIPKRKWPEVKFALGEFNGKYRGFRMVTPAEVETTSFKTRFNLNYVTCGGIYSMGTFQADYICCSSRQGLISPSNGYLRMHAVVVAKGAYYLIKSLTQGTDLTNLGLGTSIVFNDNAGLFVSEGTVF